MSSIDANVLKLRTVHLLYVYHEYMCFVSYNNYVSV